jgi:hypothetical protein
MKFARLVYLYVEGQEQEVILPSLFNYCVRFTTYAAKQVPI